MAQEDLRGPAYALEWTENQHRCSRRHFASAEKLRADIQGQGEAPQRPEPRRRLLVLHRLSVDYTRALTDLLDIDADFIDAHIGRLSYRPLVRRRKADGAATRARFACFEYPELVSMPKGLPADVKRALLARSARVEDDDDIAREPPLYAISDEKAVMFCRASLWKCAKADVLLLDRPVDDEIPSFESLLYSSLSEEWNGDPSNDVDIRSLVQDLVVHQWSGFFDAVASNISSSAHQTTALYWQAQESLERNLNSAELHERLFETSGTTYSSKSDWESLLSRLNRHVTLLSHLAPISTQPPNSNANTPSTSSPPLEKQPVYTRGVPPTELIPRRHRTTRSGNGTVAADNQNKHALDRVSYMGGILLPLSIVSSILSMSDPFSPTGPMFYVFWAVAVPLVFVAVLVIYADSIRKAEVWIEVASDSNSDSNSTNNTSASTTEEKPERDLEGQSDPYVGALGLTALGKGNENEGEEEEGEEEGVGSDSFDEPVMMVEKLFKDAGSRRWQKEQLGWGGACKTALRIYKLKKGRPPNWIRHGRTA
ncbi:hypothetical protein Daesc_002712 [Daldinia eschscholtzii]|uniref:Uncharacterized protein n=1 Tax=Daldinia eschscholtzii TaxID=292717 RepID=A0AAX6MSC6_9PEZI